MNPRSKPQEEGLSQTLGRGGISELWEPQTPEIGGNPETLELYTPGDVYPNP